ncbi:PTS glucitol/sorbitol transporter subunit IIC [Atopobium fossor]|uniref:PTS glucitol/sorbitol transporter subunit IIC n=1 Tax=Atopobium fossor TaxID=39487 RepID=UPI0004043015|nr:PTS glucitol/sorbitol transporter subunit IIC [Atopobium fossor]
MEAVNNFLIFLAEGFTGLFNAAGAQFTSFVTGMIPMLICLILTVKAIIQLIGEDRVYGFMKKCTKYAVLRYTIIPFLCCFFLTNPMAYTFGVFVDEEYKPAFYDAVVSMMHPITGLFPHANSSELFVWLGITAGYEALGKSSAPLALRFLFVGLAVCLFKGIVTEKLYKYMVARKEAKLQNN